MQRCSAIIRGLLAVSLILLSFPIASAATGLEVTELKSFDRIISHLMAKWKIPGASLAVVKDGRLVLARGYGLADVEQNLPVQPDSLMRIASISKPITAATILKLVEQKKLGLDDKVVSHLKINESTVPIDPRFGEITIRQLLDHSAGFDRTISGDPMFRSTEIAKLFKLDPPADSRAVIRFMLGQKLDFDPGTRYAYSNFGYCMLGRVIENITGKDYESAAQELVLHPAGINRMRLGKTRLSERAEDEVRYYDMQGSSEVLTPSVFKGEYRPVTRPYGGFYLEAMDSHGGWIASAVDLVRFALSVDEVKYNNDLTTRVLKPKISHLVEYRPPYAAEEKVYYGLGWQIRPIDQRANRWHMGSLPGTISLLVRTYHGMAWAVLINCRPQPIGNEHFNGDLDRSIWKAVGQVEHWPTHDLFPQFK